MSHDHLIEMCEDCDAHNCCQFCTDTECDYRAMGLPHDECVGFVCEEDPQACYTERAIAQAESLCDR